VAKGELNAAFGPGSSVQRRRRWLLFLGGFCMLWPFPYHPRINNPNENVRLYMTAAMVEEGVYEIDSMRRRWGWVNDAACVDRAPDGTRHPCEGRVKGRRHYYSVKAPGTSLLGAPAYWLYLQIVERDARGQPRVERDTALWVMRVGGTILPLLFFYAWLLAWLRREGRSDHAELVWVALVLGSPMLAYGLLFVSHTMSAAAAFGAFMILARAHRQRRVGWGGAFVAGLCAAGASFFEYPCFFASVVLCAWALFAIRPWSRILAFGAGALVPTGAMMHFQYHCFGSPLTPGHLFMENPAFRAIHERGFFGGTGFHPEAAGNLLFDLRLGLFPLTPLLLLAVVGMVLMWRRRALRAEALVLWSIVLLTFGSVCLLDNWDGGWSIGPRYLIVLYPFLGYATLIAMRAANARGRGWDVAVGSFAFGATLCGLVASGIASSFLPNPPTDFDAPLVELYLPLILENYGPYHAGLRVGWVGAVGMIPFWIAQLLAAWLALGRRPLKWVVLTAGVGVAGALLFLHTVPAQPDDPAIVEAVRYTKSIWSPKPATFQ